MRNIKALISVRAGAVTSRSGVDDENGALISDSAES